MVVVLDLSDGGELARQWREHLSCGGAFVAGARCETGTSCDLAVRLPDGGEVHVAARAVWVTAEGVGFAIETWQDEARARIEALASRVGDGDGDGDGNGDGDGDGISDGNGDGDGDGDGISDGDGDGDSIGDGGGSGDRDGGASGDRDGARRALPRPPHERLRNLNAAEQHRIARDGDVNERVLLERIYGKAVWEPLLRNPRLGLPEVARIARMGALPRPLIEIIVGNAGWLKSPEVRRALLSNPRLGADQIPRVLRLLARHELRLVPAQTAYPPPVRDAARRLLKEST
jgi:hypothetical protein